MSNEEQDPTRLLIGKIRECVIDGKWKLLESHWKKDNGGVLRPSSSVWNTFYEIKDENGEIVKNHICCIQCKKVYKYLPANGTSKLLNHQKSCLNKSILKSQSQDGNVANVVVRENRYMDDLLPEDRLILKKACSEFIIRDMRPINALFGNGLHKLLKSYVYICIKYNGLQNSPLDYLPTHHTVANDIRSQHEQVKKNLLLLLNPVFLDSDKAYGGAICLDLWTDNYRKITYMGVAIHFVNSDFELNSRIIANKALDSNKPKTGEYLKEVITSILAVYGMDINSKLITFVTDRGSNVKKALEFNTRLNDAPHFLHNTVGLILKKGRPQEVYMVCKQIVAHVKHAELNYLFAPTLKQSFEIRWNSALEMFISILENWDKLMEVLNERNENNLIGDVQLDEIADLVNLLTPFRNATLHLESRTKVTLHLSVVFYKIIEKHLQPVSTDSPLTIEAKMNCRQYFLEAIFNDGMIHIQHKLAIFLHPSLKMLNKMTAVEQRHVKQEVRFSLIVFILIHII